MDPAGDDTSLDQLVEEHLPGALRFAVRLTGDPGTAEEVLQEALVRVARGWSGFRNEASFRTWLYQIIVNVFRTHCAGTTRTGSLMADPVDHAPGPEAVSRLNELQQVISARVAALPPRQREVFVLVIWEGLTADEAARALGITTANVHSTLHVARSRLREELKPYLVEQSDE